ncbi:MAG TPA: hypothetical protein VF271_05695 [Rhodanobacteraceae bacterium]
MDYPDGKKTGKNNTHAQLRGSIAHLTTAQAIPISDGGGEAAFQVARQGGGRKT